MSEPDSDLLASFPVQTEAQYKALAHPLRTGILRLLIGAPHTNEELASALNIDSGNSLFHLKRLIQVGFVRLVGTRQNRAITEKLYRAVARAFPAGSRIDPAHKPANWDAVQTGFELFGNTAQLYPDLFRNHYIAHQVTVTLPRERVEQLMTLLNDLVREACRCHAESPGSIPVSLTAVLHALPVITPVNPTTTGSGPDSSGGSDGTR